VKVAEKPKGPEKPSTFVKELKLGPKYSAIEGMNLVEEMVFVAEQETDDYFDSTRLDNYLVLAIREVIRGQDLPKNPFPRILRSLKQSLWYNTSQNDMNKRMEAVIDNFIDETEIGLNIFTTKRQSGVFGYRFILEKINIDTVSFIKKYFAEYLTKRFEKKGDFDVRSLHSGQPQLLAQRLVHPRRLPHSLPARLRPLHRNQRSPHNHRTTIEKSFRYGHQDCSARIIRSMTI